MMRAGNRFLMASVIALVGWSGSSVWGANAVGDPEIKTDHTYYQGELAYSTLARLVASALATPGRPATGETNKDQIIKLWYWRLEHYYHLMSPQEYNIPGTAPYPPNDNPLMTDYDCLSQQFSFGHGVCGTNHAMLRPIFEAAGFQTRRRGINGDTTHEVFCNGRWVMVNTDSASIISLNNTTSSEFAGVDDIIGNINLLLNYPLAIPQYPFGSQQSGSQGTHSADWYGYYNGGFTGLTPSTSSHMYGEGYQARPIAYVLKKGETFTRFADRDGLPNYLGDAGGYRWWGYVGAGGPFRDWSYVGQATAPALQPPPTSRALANSRFGNGIFEWTPTLSAGDAADAVVAKDSNITYAATSPHLGTSSGSGKITLAFFSPYCICGKPAGGTDPATAGSTGGAWITPTAVGSVPFEISTNNGATWTTAGTLSGTTPLDFTDLVKGHHAYLMRFTVSNTAGLDAFTLKTCVEVASAVFPMLKAGGSTVTYNAGSTGVIEQNPDFSSLAAANTFKVADSGNVTFNPLSSSNSFAYQTSAGPGPISLTYRVTAPVGTTLKKVDAAADCQLRLPVASGSYTKFEVSTDGTNFSQFGMTTADTADELSHTWSYANVDVSAAAVNQVLVRITTYDGGYQCGFRFVRLYGEYSTGAPGALTITHTWDDSSGTGKTFTQNVAAGTTSTTYTVPTQSSPVSRSVAFAVAASPNSPVVTTISVSPGSASVAASGTQTFTATAKDQFGATMSPQPTFTWTVSGGGTINSSGVFTAGNTAGGPYTVTASAGGKSGTASVTVTATTTVGSVTVAPSSASVAAGGTKTYTATAKDQFGNTMSPQPTFTWTVSGGGTISSAGVFTAGNTAGGPFTITASAGGKNGTASVTVTATTTLGSISISPASANVVAQGTQTYTATAKDQFGNTMSPQPTFTWTVSGGGTINSSGVFTAGTTAGGPFTVTASSGGKSGTASVTVTATTTLSSISISPASATVLVNGSKQFTATAKDQFGNTLASQPTFTWTVSGGGTISSSGSFSAGSTAGGPFTVTASSGGKNGTANVTVAISQTLTAVVVTPNPVTVVTSTTQQFTAVANDQFGNAMVTQPTFTWTATGGTISAAGLYSAGATAGSFTVSAASGSIKGSAAVALRNPSVLTTIVVTPASVTLAPGGTQQYAAVANDQYGAALSTQPAFTWSSTLGTVNSSGLFTAPGTQGTGTVSASAGGKSGSANVTVASPPSINSPPNFSGNVTVNVPVTISSGATDPSGGSLTYHWDFGDGTTGDGSSVTHTWLSAGSFTLTLTVTSSSGASSTLTVPVTVAAAGSGGGAGQPLVPMTLSKMQGSMNFTAQNHDAVSFSGVIPGLPAGFDPTGAQLTLKVGSATLPFTLDKHGRAHSAQGSIQLALKQSKRDPQTKKTSFIGGNAPIKGKLLHGTWAGSWGFSASSPAPASITLEIDLNGTAYGATVTIAGSANAKSAKFKH